MKNFKKLLMGGLTAGILSVAAFVPSFAASTVIVSPDNTQGWHSTDVRGAGVVTYVTDATSPLPSGALQLITTNSNTDKADYLHDADTKLVDVNQLGYSTKQVSASSTTGDPSFQLPVDLNGDGAFDTTLVYEPYWNGTVTTGEWQSWDVASATGKLWSSRAYTDPNNSTCTVAAGAGGAPFYSLSNLKTDCPNAKVLGFGVNVGSYNPSYTVETDGVSFNGTTYNFEVKGNPVTKAQCRDNNGYQNYVDDNGKTFKNQGTCVNYVVKHKHTIVGNNVQYTAGSLARRAEFNMNTADNDGHFAYSDADKGSYRVDVSAIYVSGNTGWFAGRVTKASDSSNVGKWLFAKVEDNNPDKIWGSFTTEAAAKAGVANMTDPGDGPFLVTKGNIKVK